MTNNLAERDLRPIVISRKISFGSQSKKGAEATAVNTSVIQTIKKIKLPMVETIQSLILISWETLKDYPWNNCDLVPYNL